MMTPNRRLRQTRELRGWSQAKVAEQVGTDATTVSRWERGLFSPTPYFRERLCTLFGKNAQELGLLDVASQPQEQVIGQRTDALYTRDSAIPLAPSWSQRADTFTYILQSAAHDELAHTLWENAYVRALQGQDVQAQELGEASLNAFEQVGHTNASAIREWLSQRGLDASPPPTTEKLATTHPAISQLHERSARRRKRASFFLLLFLVGSILSSSLFLSPWHATASPRASSPPVEKTHNPMHPLADASSVAHSTPISTSSPAATATPTAAATATPTASATATPTASASASATSTVSSTVAIYSPITVKVVPARLSSQNCASEAPGYRCTLTLWLFGDEQSAFTWQASSRGVGAQFNPASGVGQPGQSYQIIVYIQSSPGENGTLVFAFTVSKHTYTASVNWS